MSVQNRAEVLVQQILDSLTLEIEASGRHVHLTQSQVESLFGHALEEVRPLSQPGQFVSAQRVTLVGPRGKIPNVVVLGPPRPHAQVEISLTDGIALGVRPPVRLSGDVANTPGITLQAEGHTLTLEEGLMVAKRHIHLSPEDARRFGVADGQTVALRTFTQRPVVLHEVSVRVSDQFSSAVHLDYDEANACGWQKGDRGWLMPPQTQKEGTIW